MTELPSHLNWNGVTNDLLNLITSQTNRTYFENVSSLVIFQGPSESFEDLCDLLLTENGEKPIHQDLDPDWDRVWSVEDERSDLEDEVGRDGFDTHAIQELGGRVAGSGRQGVQHRVTLLMMFGISQIDILNLKLA